MRGFGTFLRNAVRLSAPYFRSEERWIAWGLLGGAIALNLLLVAVNVVLNYWNRDIYNTLQDKDWHGFIALIFWWWSDGKSVMPGFVILAAIYIPVAIYRTYLRQWLEIRWRRWLTARIVDDWLADHAYYRISLAADPQGEGTDNPDQRIGDDIRDFIADTLTLSLSLLSNVVNVISFLSILWTLSGVVTLLGVAIPGYMVWVALIYSILGTWITHLVGRPLAFLNFQRQRVEADFRYALVRLRENTEGVALQGGEEEERQGLSHRFAAVAANWWGIMRRTKMLNGLVAGYGQVAGIFPLVVAAPRYFSGKIALGQLMQTAGAFGEVQSGLSWAVDAYASLARWQAEVERLTTFLGALRAARALSGTGAALQQGKGSDWETRGLTLRLPDGTALLDGAGLRFPKGRATLITGRSGTGKSTLFRALAGIWPFGAGTVERPPGTYLFLPQRPYFPLGTLRHALTYPVSDGAYPDDAVRAVLADVGLGALAPALDTAENWSQRLSGGEQQRLAIARALLLKPDWLFLDEATASLDPEAEGDLYRLLRERLPGTTLVSIAHRESVARFHDARLVLGRPAGEPGRLAAAE
jgi:putative ATP-binding cassette transporter